MKLLPLQGILKALPISSLLEMFWPRSTEQLNLQRVQPCCLWFAFNALPWLPLSCPGCSGWATRPWVALDALVGHPGPKLAIVYWPAGRPLVHLRQGSDEQDLLWPWQCTTSANHNELSDQVWYNQWSSLIQWWRPGYFVNAVFLEGEKNFQPSSNLGMTNYLGELFLFRQFLATSEKVNT